VALSPPRAPLAMAAGAEILAGPFRWRSGHPMHTPFRTEVQSFVVLGAPFAGAGHNEDIATAESSNRGHATTYTEHGFPVCHRNSDGLKLPTVDSMAVDY
jgi:hypothetical protein